MELRPHQIRGYDMLVDSMKKGNRRIVLAAPCAYGKAQPLTSSVLLASGEFVPMGSIEVGDELASKDGGPSVVTGVYPQGKKGVYSVTLRDGSVTKACDEHLWEITTTWNKRPHVVTTERLAEIVATKNNAAKISPYSGDVGFGDAGISADPWVVGALIGDGGLGGGSLSFSNSDEFMVKKMRDLCGVGMVSQSEGGIDYYLTTPRGEPNVLLQEIERIGLRGCKSNGKFIPSEYYHSSRCTRLKLINGMMDTDGWVEKSKAIAWGSVSRRLAEGMQRLLRSIGARAKMRVATKYFTYKGERKKGQPFYELYISHFNERELFTMPHKLQRVRQRTVTSMNTVVSCEISGEEECQCISVSHTSKLYLTDDYIVTHNTVLAGHLLQEAAKKGKKGAILCDRVQLIEQSLDKFDALGMDCGVIQGQHERTNWSAQTKIISIQTLARRKKLPELDFVIVDESHTLYKTVTDMMEQYNGIPVIGLSATPYSKGMGKYYQDLVVPVTTRQLLDQGYLCPVKYYAGATPDLEKVKLKSMRTGGRDYDDKSLAIEMEKPKLIGDIVKTWKEKGENSQTIAFCPSKVHSQGLVKAFMDAGVPAVHIDDKTPAEERQEIYQQHNDGLFKVLSCCMLLNTGYDSPSTRCLIDARPTKSLIAFVQRAGRVMRTFEGKEYGIYLDHASNVARHGFPEDVVPEELDDGEKEYNEKKLTKKDETDEKEPRSCPKCSAIMAGVICGACGAKLPPTRKEIETVEGELRELQQIQINQDFYSGLLHHAKEKGYSEGWAAHTYKEKFGDFPTGAKPEAKVPNNEVKAYIKYKNIRRAKSKYGHKKASAKTASKSMDVINGLLS